MVHQRSLRLTHGYGLEPRTAQLMLEIETIDMYM